MSKENEDRDCWIMKALLEKYTDLLHSSFTTTGNEILFMRVRAHTVIHTCTHTRNGDVERD